jgi:PAS domain S-box-containing protein
VELYERRAELEALNSQLEAARVQLQAQHEQALAERDAHLNAVFEHPSQLILVFEAIRDEAGAVVDCVYRNANHNANTFIARERNALIGARVSEVFPERAQRFFEQCTRVLSTGEPLRYETELPDGRALISTLHRAGGDTLISTSVDVTDRRRAEAALRDSERRFRAMFDEAPVGVAYNTMNGRFVYANKAFCLMLGYSAKELEQRTWQEVTHPDDVSGDLAAGRQVLDGKQSYYTMDKRYVRKDGTTVWVSLFGNFVRNDRDDPVEGVAVAIDVTERRAIDQALKDSEQRFRLLANHIDQFTWICDTLGQRVWCNQRWYDYTGRDPQGALGTAWQSVVHPDHVEHVTTSLQRSLTSGEPWEDTYPIRSRDGQYRWFLSRAVPIRDGAGQIMQWFGTNTDVTELSRLRSDLEAADRQKDEFLAMLAHELRNPVAPIRSAAEVLALGLQEDRHRSMVGIIRRQSDHLAHILNDLLDVARITRGQITLQSDTVTIASCIDIAVETAEPQLKDKRQRLTVEHSRDSLKVRADEVRIGQCIANVLSNAAKYSAAESDIRVRSYRDGQHAVVEVRDHGIGIAPEYQANVFDLFYQAPRSVDRGQGGLGLGLAICKRLMEMHNGTIRCRSNGTGQGATFEMRLPLYEGDEPAIEAPQKSSSRRVLVVDDNKDAADALSTFLQMKGHQTRTAYSGNEAIQEVLAFGPEVVLLDIGLPGMNGYDAARRIRAIDSAIQLIALTGYGQSTDRRRSAAAGFDMHLTKPVGIEELEAALLR